MGDQRLPGQRTDDIQPGGRRNDIADLGVEVPGDGSLQGQGQQRSDPSHQWRVVATEFSHRNLFAKFDDLGDPKGGLGCRQKTPALDPAGPVGHVVGNECVTPLVDTLQDMFPAVNRDEKRQDATRGVLHQRFEESCQRFHVGDQALSPGRFQSRRMRKTARRKSRIGQLPECPLGTDHHSAIPDPCRPRISPNAGGEHTHCPMAPPAGAGRHKSGVILTDCLTVISNRSNRSVACGRKIRFTGMIRPIRTSR